MPTPKLTRATAIRFARLHIDGAPDPDFAVKVAELWQAAMYNAPPGSLNLIALRTSRAVLNNLYALVGTEPIVYLKREQHWQGWTPEIIEWVAAVGEAAATRLAAEPGWAPIPHDKGTRIRANASTALEFLPLLVPIEPEVFISQHPIEACREWTPEVLAWVAEVGKTVAKWRS
jgi:hypothetical protein